MITTIATNEEIPQILVEGIFDDEAYCKLSVLTDAGWNECEFKRDGKYIVFELNNNGIFAIEKVIKKDRTPYIMIVCGAIILTAAFAAVIAVKRRRGKNKAE